MLKVEQEVVKKSLSFAGIDEKLLVLPSKAIETLMSQPCDAREVVLQLKDCLKLDEVSLENPDPETKRLIRCLANKAKQSNRPDVVRELREVAPAGTTGIKFVVGVNVSADAEIIFWIAGESSRLERVQRVGKARVYLGESRHASPENFEI